jgi:hypothetical protein
MWARIINSLLGLWLMASPAILGFGKTAADNDHIAGPVIVSAAVIAIWEATRGMRKLNIVLGAWLLLAPWVLGYEETIPIVNDMVVGALVIAFALVKGKVEQQFGGGWRALFKPDSPHTREAKERRAGN